MYDRLRGGRAQPLPHLTHKKRHAMYNPIPACHLPTHRAGTQEALKKAEGCSVPVLQPLWPCCSRRDGQKCSLCTRVVPVGCSELAIKIVRRGAETSCSTSGDAPSWIRHLSASDMYLLVLYCHGWLSPHQCPELMLAWLAVRTPTSKSGSTCHW